VAAFYFLDLGKYLTLESLKSNRAQLMELRAAHAFLFAAVFVLIYVFQTAFSLPGAAILFLPRERSSGSSRDAVRGVGRHRRSHPRVPRQPDAAAGLGCYEVRRADGGIDRGLRENGLSYLLFLRLVPAFPFFLVNSPAASRDCRFGPTLWAR